MLLAVIILAVFLVLCLVLLCKLYSQARQMRQLATEAENSRLQYMQEQKRNQQLKQEMTNNISHELKTPVASITGFLEILLGNHPITDQQRQQYLQRCYAQTCRLSDLIRDVALINKLEEADDLFPKATTDVYAILNNLIDELQFHAQEHHITIHNRLPKTLAVNGNSDLVYSIFRNLIENSIAYAGDGVSIEVECYKSDEKYYYIRYYDTGVGVPTEYLPKLFDRFLRIDEGRSRSRGGTGLGLAIVKHAVAFHGGQVYAKCHTPSGLELLFSLGK